MEAQSLPVTATPAQANAKRTRAEAAVIAAATFGRTSLFDTARVSGAALKAALRDAAQRIVLSTPGIAPNCAVSVVFAGEGAYVAHSWRSVNKARELVVDAAVFLPDVDDVAMVPRALADEMLAMLLHELAHAFFTNDRDFKFQIYALAQRHQIDPSQVKDLLNAIEDGTHRTRVDGVRLCRGFPHR
jgi:hypothetical protein